ncbi:MAG: hypothetical protein LC808_23855 [Actinobacteria bacterium]|nr:hypothetical protein [Actinomycetota bacterium]
MANIVPLNKVEERATASGFDPVYLWHYRTHQEWADERLHFWTMHFRPQYDRDEILGVIAEILDSHQVYSYVIYEMLGFWDILLRAWVPNAMHARQRPEESIERLLRSKLKGSSLWELEGFAVTAMEHFASPLITERPADPPPQELLDRVDRYNATVLNGRPAYSSVAQITPMTEEEQSLLRSEVSQLFTDGYLTAFDADVPGVKFAITIGNPIKPLQPNKRDDLYRQIRALALQVQGNFPQVTTHPKPELSLYSGSGELGTYLILAKAPPR